MSNFSKKKLKVIIEANNMTLFLPVYIRIYTLLEEIGLISNCGMKFKRRMLPQSYRICRIQCFVISTKPAGMYCTTRLATRASQLNFTGCPESKRKKKPRTGLKVKMKYCGVVMSRYHLICEIMQDLSYSVERLEGHGWMAG